MDQRGAHAHGRHKRLLIVDGDLKRAQRLAGRLSHLPFDVEIADNGAIGLLKAHVERPDVVVACSELPMLNGDLLLEALRSKPETRDLTVIVLTEGCGNDEMSRCWKAGADLCIPRNTGEADVVATLHRVLGGMEHHSYDRREPAFVA